MMISNKISVAVAALGRLLDMQWDDALDLIHTYRITHHEPDTLLIDHARKYINGGGEA